MHHDLDVSGTSRQGGEGLNRGDTMAAFCCGYAKNDMFANPEIRRLTRNTRAAFLALGVEVRDHARPSYRDLEI